MASRIPPLLDTYLGLPPETSLVLLSGILGSSTNWLVFRYLYSLLSVPSKPVAKEDGINVVLVSFLRDYTFWKDGAGKLGVDLDVSTRKGKFVFVDGLSNLFHPSQSHTPTRTPGGVSGWRILPSATLQHLRKGLEDAVTQVQHSASSEQRTVLIVDQPDLLLAASGDGISSQGLRETLLGIRETVHSSIVTLSADEPLISSQATSLEKDHAALGVSLVHDAHLVISLRMLDTGAARDVSGVLRVTPGGGTDDRIEIVEEKELLYFVASDGGVRVFERGQ
ncbi:60S ribosomal protein L37B [Hypoxylon texense]